MGLHRRFCGVWGVSEQFEVKESSAETHDAASFGIPGTEALGNAVLALQGEVFWPVAAFRCAASFGEICGGVNCVGKFGAEFGKGAALSWVPENEFYFLVCMIEA